MKTKKPNIVLIIIDALRQDHLSCYGYPKKTSPNIDKIAKEGLLFENFYSTSYWTLPTHASLFTGFYLTEHQTIYGNDIFNPNFKSLAEKLKEQGYKTVGFSGNPFISRYFGFDRGFDFFKDPFSKEKDIIDWRDFLKKRKHEKGLLKYFEIIKHFSKEKKKGKKIFASLKAGLKFKFYEFFLRLQRGDKGAKKVLQKIKKEKKKLLKEPYFLFINFMEVHGPYRPPLRYSPFLLNHPFWFFFSPYPFPNDYQAGKANLSFNDLQDLKKFYEAEIRYIDEIIGKLFQELKNENTIFVITSDHGEEFGEHGSFTHTFGLYNTLFEIPLIIWGLDKGRIKKAFQLTDLHFSLLSLAGIKEKTWHSGSFFDGFEKELIFGEYFIGDKKALEKRYSKEVVKKYWDFEIKAIIKDQWKYIKNFTTKKEELYFLKDDPQEKNDLSSKNPEILENMRNLLNDFLSKLQKCENVKKTEEREDIQKHLQALGYI